MDESVRPQRRQRPVDPLALERQRRRVAGAEGLPWLHGESARRLAARLHILRRTPDAVIDWGSHPQDRGEALRQALPRALVTRVHEVIRQSSGAASAREPAQPWWRPRHWRAKPPEASLGPAEVAEASVDLLWSNMALLGHLDPQPLMVAWLRALRWEGVLMFATLGPGSLTELADLYRRLRWPPAMAPLVDMHDLGDMLVGAGFSDPVMDQETLTLTWPSARALVDELRTLGGNVDPLRGPGLRTARWRDRLEAELSASLTGADGRLAVSMELVYGHAVKLPQARISPSTSVSLDAMRSMVRQRR